MRITQTTVELLNREIGRLAGIAPVETISRPGDGRTHYVMTESMTSTYYGARQATAYLLGVLAGLDPDGPARHADSRPAWIDTIETAFVLGCIPARQVAANQAGRAYGETLRETAQNNAPRSEPGTASWDMWAHDRGGRYDNPGEKWWVEIHGLPYPVVPVTVTEVAGDAPDATHWGWIDARKSTSQLAGVPCMIWAFRGAFDAQFPYGAAAEVEVEAGKGRVVRLRITARKIPPA
jgi:hypothetical protein